MPEWTNEQRQAIYATGGSVLVSAAAGSGKTAVLVERVIKLITRAENPIDADRMLIVTFTRDAAAEMKQRISDALSALLADDPYNPQLLRQRQLLYNASISTIDSFCANIIREYFHTLEISPDFRAAEQTELELLQAEAMDAAVEYFYDKDSDDFKKLLDAFSGKEGDANLRKTVLRICDFLDTQPFPEEWLENMLTEYRTDDVLNSVWGKIITDAAHSAVSHGVTLAESSLLVLEKEGDEKLSEKLRPVIEDDLSIFTSIQTDLLSGDWDSVVERVNSCALKRLSTPRGYKENAAKIAVAANRDEFKATIEKLKRIFCRTSAEAKQEIDELYIIVRALFALTQKFINEFNILKKNKDILSFADTELLTVKLLARSNGSGGYIKTAQAREISTRFDAVIVDEFQDVNDVQNLIFNCVSKDETNLFVVGDVKQSIYGFRQAKPNIFIDRRQSYNRYDEAKQNYPATIVLDKNFRSRAEVCDTVNFVFSNLMKRDCAGMDYTVDERLNVGAVYPEGAGCETEISLIEKSAFDDLETPQLEATYIASRIKQIIGSTFTVSKNGDTRRATFGDFAVIMRSPKSTASQYVETLVQNGVPAFSEESESAFEAQEVKLILNLMRVIDNPSQDIPLLSVLCSPLYGFTPDELAEMRADSRKKPLYQSLVKYAEKSPKAADFLDELNSLRRFSYTCAVDDLIGRLYGSTSIGAVTAAVRGGDRPLSNLNLLRLYAQSYRSGGYKTLTDFIGFIDRLIDNKTVLPSDSAADVHSLNGVRVLSVHKSKGLEYPVCFLAGTAKRFNKTDLRSDVLIDSRAGLGIKRKDGVCRYNTLPRLAVELEIERNEIAEELRVLYVALTRAREKLIVVGTMSKTDSFIEKTTAKLAMGSIIEPYTVSNSGTIIEWLALTALANPSTRRQMNPYAENIILKENYPTWIFNHIKTEAELFAGAKADAEQEAEQIVRAAKTEFNYAELLRKNLSFKYKNEAILNLPQKVSASQAAHGQNTEYFDRVIAKPNFMSGETAAAVERGTAHHLFLQYCDFEKARADIGAEIERLKNIGRLTPQQSQSIDAPKLEKLLKSKLFDRVLSSPAVFREERFAAKIKPSMVFDGYDDVDTDFRIIMQGAVDLAFVEDGKLVIVDYKTDRVRDIQKLCTLYQKQLELYSEAMRQSLEIEVAECIICSVHLNEWTSLK